MFFNTFQVDVSNIPKLKFAVDVDACLGFKLFINGRPIDASEICHITIQTNISTWSQLLNILAFMKSKSDINKNEEPKFSTADLAKAIDALADEEPDDSKAKKLYFLSEQLTLTDKLPKQRRYVSIFLPTILSMKKIQSFKATKNDRMVKKIQMFQ